MVVSCLRVAILYALIIGALRLMGKRQIGQLEPSELVITILISEIAAVPMQDPGIPLLFGVLPILVLLSLEILLSAGLLKSKRFRTVICGRPSVIIENGVILQHELRRNRLMLDEVLQELRASAVTDLSTVQFGILETSGTLSVILYPQFQPATTGQVGQGNESGGLPLTLIQDGKVMAENIRKRGLNQDWLRDQMIKHGTQRAEDVFFLTVDEQGKVYCLPKQPAYKR